MAVLWLLCHEGDASVEGFIFMGTIFRAILLQALALVQLKEKQNLLMGVGRLEIMKASKIL